MKTMMVLRLVAFYFAVQAEDIKNVLPDSKGGSEVESCDCVPYSRCNNIVTDPDSEGDIRTNSSCDYLSVCCSKQDIIEVEPSSPSKKLEPCGVHNLGGLSFTILDSNDNEAEFGEFPWMAALLREKEKNSTKRLVYRCGGALIHPQVITTAAHCIGDQKEKLKVRLGEWDTQAERELYPHQDRDVKTIIIHPEFNNKTLVNDIALLVLDKPVEIATHVDVVCLPKQDMVLDESKCFATGWGSSSEGGKYQEILKKVELPLVPNNSCQESLRKTRLGNRFQLNASFICAAGASNRDTCKGDGGSPLVCPIPGLPGRYLQAGIVSWGIGCGHDQVPGVYTNVAKYSDWIDEQLTKKNFRLSYYKYYCGKNISHGLFALCKYGFIK